MHAQSAHIGELTNSRNLGESSKPSSGRRSWVRWGCESVVVRAYAALSGLLGGPVQLRCVFRMSRLPLASGLRMAACPRHWWPTGLWLACAAFRVCHELARRVGSLGRESLFVESGATLERGSSWRECRFLLTPAAKKNNPAALSAPLELVKISGSKRCALAGDQVGKSARGTPWAAKLGSCVSLRVRS